jgi:hypothetical protein
MPENENHETSDGQDIDIEQIMQEIRARILAQQSQLPGYAETLVNVSGKRFSPAFYEQLYQANLAHNEVGVDIQVTPVSLPLIGPLVEALRHKLHELVLFYVNQVTSQQRQVNAHLLQALSLMAEELDEAPAEPPESKDPSNSPSASATS